MDLELRDSPSSPGGPPTFTLPKRQETKRIALTDPRDLDQPFAIRSLDTLASYLVIPPMRNAMRTQLTSVV
jgi:hypothetical protein